MPVEAAARARAETPLSVCDAEGFAPVDRFVDLFRPQRHAPNRIFVHDDEAMIAALPLGQNPGRLVFGSTPWPELMTAPRGEGPMRAAYSFALDEGVLAPGSGAVATRDRALVRVSIENAGHSGGIQFRDETFGARDGRLFARWDEARLPRMDGLCIAGLGISIGNYGHFLFDGLPGLHLLAGALLARGIEFRILAPPLNAWQRECLDLLQLRSHVLTCDGPVRAATLVSTSLISHHVDCPTRFQRPMFDAMRFAVACDRAAPQKLYLARRGQMRAFKNVDEIEALLARRGYTVIAPEHLGVAAQARLLSRARIVVGQTGAQLANIGFAPPGAAILEIMPATRPERWIRTTAALLGLHWHGLVCAVRTEDFIPMQVGGVFRPGEDFTFTVPPDELDAALATIEAARGAA